MVKNKWAGIIILVLALGAGFYFFHKSSAKPQFKEGASEKEAQEKSRTQENQGKSSEGKVVEGYTGRVLAGTKAPFIIFNLPDYEKALKDNKVIVLDFFANWCPECRAEAPQLHAGFDALNSDKVIGFRVNYNDTDTDKDERDLAGKYAITFQHTKIIIKNGKEFSKSVITWDKETFLLEVNKAL